MLQTTQVTKLASLLRDDPCSVFRQPAKSDSHPNATKAVLVRMWYAHDELAAGACRRPLLNCLANTLTYKADSYGTAARTWLTACIGITRGGDRGRVLGTACAFQSAARNWQE